MVVYYYISSETSTQQNFLKYLQTFSFKCHKALIGLYNNSAFQYPYFTLNCGKILVELHSQKKGTKAVTGTVPFQKVNFCPF